MSEICLKEMFFQIKTNINDLPSKEKNIKKRNVSKATERSKTSENTSDLKLDTN